MKKIEKIVDEIKVKYLKTKQSRLDSKIQDDAFVKLINDLNQQQVEKLLIFADALLEKFNHYNLYTAQQCLKKKI